MTDRGKRLSILSKKELNDVYGLPVFNDDERAFYFSLEEDEELLMKSLRSRVSQVHFILQLGYFKAKYMFFEHSFKACSDDVQYIGETYFKGFPIGKEAVAKRTCFNNYNRILALSQYNFMTDITQKKLISHVFNLAKICVDPRYLFDQTVTYLTDQRIVLPGYSTLQDMIGQVLNLETKRLHTLMEQNISESINVAFKNLLTHSPDEDKKVSVDRDISDHENTKATQKKQTNKNTTLHKLYGITVLKKDSRGFNYDEMKQEIIKKKTSEPLFNEAVKIIPILDISTQNVVYYASLVDYYSVDRLNELDYAPARLYLLCYVYYRYEKIHDNLITMLLYRFSLYEKQGKKAAKEAVYEYKRETNGYDTVIADILDVIMDECIEDKDVRLAAFKIAPKEQIPELTKHLRDQLCDEAQFKWDYYLKIAKIITKNVRPLVCAIDFECEDPDHPLMKSLQFIKDTFAKNQSLKQQPFSLFPIDFIPESLQAYLYEIEERDGTIQTVLNVYKYEFLVYYRLINALESETFFVNKSINFKQFKKDLYQGFNDNKEVILKTLNNPILNKPIGEHLKELREEYTKKFLAVNAAIKNGENKAIHIKKESTVIKKGVHEKVIEWTLPYPKKESIENASFYDQLPQVSLNQALRFVNEHCQFVDEFSHIKSRYAKSKVDEDSLFATITALASGHGIFHMAEISDISYTRLLATLKNFIWLENLKKTNVKIVNKLADLPIFKHWSLLDNKIISSIDGKKVLTRRNHFMARHSSKYFGQKRGVVLYSMITNNACTNASVVSPNDYEGHSAFDVVFNNKTDVKPDFLSGDTHSINQVNFALMNLIGCMFIPHIKNIREQAGKIGSFDSLGTHKDAFLTPFHTYNEKLIEEEWPNIQHIFVSLLCKHTTQRVIVRKLGSHSRHSKTIRALWEYNKIMHDQHVLNVIDDPELRVATRTSLNRGEGYHQLTGKIIKINGNKLRGTTELELNLSSECIRLIANAIIFYNAYLLSQLYEQHEKLGNTDILEFIKKISPIAWRHINLNGRYEFGTVLEALNLRSILDKVVFGFSAQSAKS